MAVRYVCHVEGEDGDVVWQFHADNGDYRSSVLQLVSLEQILEIDPSLSELADLPLGYCARRESQASAWVIAPDSD